MGGDVLKATLNTLRGGRTTIVKIDVEGAELLVLNGLAGWLSETGVRRVIIEINREALSRFSATPKDIYDQMHAFGFSGQLGVVSKPVYNEIFDKDS